MKSTITSCFYPRLFVREYYNPNIIALNGNPIFRLWKPRFDKFSGLRLSRGLDNSPLLLIQIDEVVLLRVGHVLDERCIHFKVVDHFRRTVIITKGGEDFMDVADDTLGCVISNVVDWSAKAFQHELSSHTNTQKAVPTRMRLRLRQTDLRKARQRCGILNDSSIRSFEPLLGFSHPETICKDASQSVNVSTSLGSSYRRWV